MHCINLNHILCLLRCITFNYSTTTNIGTWQTLLRSQINMCRHGRHLELMDSNSTSRSAGKKTYNCSVGVCGTWNGDIKNNYYGVLKDIVEIEYVGEPLKRCVLFSCEWFDPTLNCRKLSHKLSKVIRVHRTRRYRKYDPFIFSNTASQVYFIPYLDYSRDRVNWLLVIPTKPRVRMDKQYILHTACQQTGMTTSSNVWVMLSLHH